MSKILSPAAINAMHTVLEFAAAQADRKFWDTFEVRRAIDVVIAELPDRANPPHVSSLGFDLRDLALCMAPSK